MDNELSISYLIEIIKKWFFFIVLLVILGVGCAYIYNAGAEVKYQSQTTLYVEPSVNSSVVDYQGILTNQKMVKTYSTIIKSRRVVNTVIETLGLDMTYDDMLNILTVSNDSDTQIITIAIKHSDNKLASEIANCFAQTLIEDLRKEMEISNIRVIDEAIISDKEVEPKRNINMIIGGAIGAMAGVAISFLLSALDNKIKTHDDVKKYLKIKTLGIIPLNSLDVKGKKKNKYNKIEAGTPIKILDETDSVISESIRMIRTNLDFADLKIINVTSTTPSEGKSEFITNLACSFAMLDKRVLLIDCDMRKPKIHRNFGVARDKGLSDCLLSKFVSYKDVIQRFDRNNVHIDILAAGSLVYNPSELINSANFLSLLNSLRSSYDIILIDCPPISNLTDGVLVSKLSDGTIYVIESDKIDRELVMNSIDELHDNGATLLGAVLTKVDIKKEKAKYGYKYDYYYSSNK